MDIVEYDIDTVYNEWCVEEKLYRDYIEKQKNISFFIYISNNSCIYIVLKFIFNFIILYMLKIKIKKKKYQKKNN